VSTTGGREKKRHTVPERSQVVRVIWPGAVQSPRPDPVPTPPPEPQPTPQPAPPPAERQDYSRRLDAATASRQPCMARHGREPSARDLAPHLHRLGLEARRGPGLAAVLKDI